MRCRSAASTFSGVQAREARVRDETDAGVAGVAHDRDLLVDGQLAHRPGAESELDRRYPLTPVIATPSTKKRWPNTYSRKIGSQAQRDTRHQDVQLRFIAPENCAITSVSGRSDGDWTTISGQRYMFQAASAVITP